MRRSIRSLNIPPEGTTGIWTFEDRFVQIPSTRGQNCVQVLHPRARFDGPFFTKGEISDRDFLLIN